MLRPFQADDIEGYTASIFGDAEVTRYLPKRDTPARERALRTMDFFIAHWQEYGYGPWAVADKAKGELIGDCGLRFIPELNETEVLYAFAKPTWGKGIATEAVRVSIEDGFSIPPRNARRHTRRLDLSERRSCGAAH